MKKRTDLGALVLKALVCLAFVVPVFSSCMGLEELRGKVDELESRLDSLELSLNNQLDALDAFCSGKTTISELKENNDGSHTVELSDGTTFTVYPKSTEHCNLLTYVEIEDVKYWATYNALGEAVALLDVDGNMIPVQTEVVMPTVKERDGEFILVIGDEEFTTGFTREDVVTVFSSYELNVDDSGNVYSVTFTFGEGMEFTISLEEYKGFSFHAVGDVSAKVIKDYYVALGQTSRVSINIDDVIDYVMQIPDGWRVKEVIDEYTNEAFLDITAPVQSAIDEGAAVASGDLKVIAVVEGDRSMVARLELSSTPFKKFVATSSNAIIEKYNGVDKFVYGLSTFNAFDEAAVLASAKEILAKNENGVSEGNVNQTLASILGAELVTGDYYVLWAIPAFYSEADGFIPGDLYKYEFGSTTASISVAPEDILFNDVKVSVKLAGFSAYYGGTAVKTDDLFTRILTYIQNAVYTPYSTPMVYEGSAFNFPSAAANEGLEIASGVTYVTWMVPVNDVQDGAEVVYTKDDIVYTEFTLPEVSAGGELALTAGTPDVSRVSVKVPLAAEGATRIYYTWLTSRNASRYSEDADRAMYLLDNGTCVNASEALAVIEDIEPETTMVLFAMCTDEQGKYGPVTVSEHKTNKLVYNKLKVSVEATDIGEDFASLSINVTDGTATEFVYWAGRDTDEFWTSLNGSNQNDKKSSAQKKIALYPDDSAVQSAMRKYPIVNGKIEMTGLMGEKQYHVVLLAKDESGEYSYAAHAPFKTLAVNLGIVVTQDNPQWETAKNSIKVTCIPGTYYKIGEFAAYSFTYQGPTDMTAYIVGASKMYFEGAGLTAVQEQIIDIKDYATRPIDGSSYQDGSEVWYDDEGVQQVGNVVDLITYGVHGLKTAGALTYFSSDHHGEANCADCEDRVNDPTASVDRSYNGTLARIQARSTRTYYEEYVKKRYNITNVESIKKTVDGLMELYSEYYSNLKPELYINDGSALTIQQPSGFGPDEQGEDRDAVIVVLRDKDNNYYEPMFFPVENLWN